MQILVDELTSIYKAENKILHKLENSKFQQFNIYKTRIYKINPNCEYLLYQQLEIGNKSNLLNYQLITDGDIK